MVIISAIAIPAIALTGQSQSREQLYVVLGKHCFNRELNERLFNELIAHGENKEIAEEKASGKFIVNNDFCSHYRALIETMSESAQSIRR